MLCYVMYLPWPTSEDHPPSSSIKQCQCYLQCGANWDITRYAPLSVPSGVPSCFRNINLGSRVTRRCCMTTDYCVYNTISSVCHTSNRVLNLLLRYIHYVASEKTRSEWRETMICLPYIYLPPIRCILTFRKKSNFTTVQYSKKTRL